MTGGHGLRGQDGSWLPLRRRGWSWWVQSATAKPDGGCFTLLNRNLPLGNGRLRTETTARTWEARESLLEDRTKEPEPGHYRRNGALGEKRAPQFLPAGRALRNRHAVHEQLDRPGGQTISGDGVIAVEGVDLEPVVRELRVEDRDRRVQAAHLHFAGVAVDDDRVLAVGAADHEPIDRTVAGAGGAFEDDLETRKVSSSQVADVDQVGSRESLEVDVLQAGGVHRHHADVAEEPHAVSVRRHVDVLGDVVADEEHRVVACLALDDVASVAGIPDEGVVPGAHQSHVVALAAEERVVPVPAHQLVVA